MITAAAPANLIPYVILIQATTTSTQKNANANVLNQLSLAKQVTPSTPSFVLASAFRKTANQEWHGVLSTVVAFASLRSARSPSTGELILMSQPTAAVSASPICARPVTIGTRKFATVSALLRLVTTHAPKVFTGTVLLAVADAFLLIALR